MFGEEFITGVAVPSSDNHTLPSPNSQHRGIESDGIYCLLFPTFFMSCVVDSMVTSHSSTLCHEIEFLPCRFAVTPDIV